MSGTIVHGYCQSAESRSQIQTNIRLKFMLYEYVQTKK